MDKKYAVINNTESSGQWAKKKRGVYDKIYILGENFNGELAAEAGNIVAVPSSEIRAKKTDRLNVLFMSSFDSMNSVFAELIMELERRGHRAVVAVVDRNDASGNKYYDENGIGYYSRTEISGPMLNFIDIAVLAPLPIGLFSQIYWQVKTRDVFSVSFASLFSSVAMRAFADVVLCIGESKVDEFRLNGLRYNFVISGNPQYDALVRSKQERSGVVSDKIKKVLVIDQGGYPFGAKGKKQLAETLADIAANNPDMIFDIKPRYPKHERGMMLHSVSDHLVDYFGDMPDNMAFIDEPGILEDIVPSYDAMISTWSTAYLDAVVFDMPLLLIEGFDSVDVFDVRTHRIQEAYDHLRATGCLRHYSEIRNGRLQFSLADKGYVEREVYRPDKESAPAIVSYFEIAKKELLLDGIRYCRYFTSRVDTPLERKYESADGVPEYKKISDENYPAFRTYRYELNRFMQEVAFQNRCMGNVLDISRLDSLYHAPEPEPVPIDRLGEYVEELRASFDIRRQELLSSYFESSEGMALAGRDKIMQDYYFDWLFENGFYERLLHPDVELLAPESREYNMARLSLKRRRYLAALRHLGRFIDLVKSSEYEMQLAKSKRMRLTTQPFREGPLLALFAAYFMFTRRYGIFESVKDATVSASAGLTLFRMKDMNSRGRYDLSKSAYAQYTEYYRQKSRKKRKKSITRRLKYIRNLPIKLLVNIEYRRTLRLSGQNERTD